MKNLNPKLIQLVKLLNDLQFHAGSELGEKLKLTRAAVWKMIHTLTSLGIIIESVHGKGYCFKQPLILLDPVSIKRHIEDPALRKLVKLVCFARVSSTNDILRDKKLSPRDRALVCLAEQMTAGRGRLNRHWVAPFANNIYFSCLYQFNKDISELAGLSLVVSLAVVKTLAALVGPALKVKWPNDVLWEGKKLAGILIDIFAEPHGMACVVIGIGINVNMLQETAPPIDQPWTSLQEITEQYQDRNRIVGALIGNLVNYLQLFSEHQLAWFLPQWQDHDYLANQAITLTNFQQVVSGTMVGIDAQGHLLLKDASGEVKPYAAGDTSIHKEAVTNA